MPVRLGNFVRTTDLYGTSGDGGVLAYIQNVNPDFVAKITTDAARRRVDTVYWSVPHGVTKLQQDNWRPADEFYAFYLAAGVAPTFNIPIVRGSLIWNQMVSGGYNPLAAGQPYINVTALTPRVLDDNGLYYGANIAVTYFMPENYSTDSLFTDIVAGFAAPFTGGASLVFANNSLEKAAGKIAIAGGAIITASVGGPLVAGELGLTGPSATVGAQLVGAGISKTIAAAEGAVLPDNAQYRPTSGTSTGAAGITRNGSAGAPRAGLDIVPRGEQVGPQATDPVTPVKLTIGLGVIVLLLSFVDDAAGYFLAKEAA